jgi:hypothetical protein
LHIEDNLRWGMTPEEARRQAMIKWGALSLQRMLTSLVPELVPLANTDIPSFHELRNVDGTFFRRGAALSYKDEMPEELHELFWAQPENALAMQRLGYYK